MLVTRVSPRVKHWTCAVCIFPFQVVSLYGKDPSVTSMMDKVDLAILPVMNVDGYAYSWTKVTLQDQDVSKYKVF